MRQIDTFGNVSIAVPTGSLFDGNQEQTDDAATQEALLSLWADLRLTGDDALTKRNEQWLFIAAAWNSFMAIIGV